MKRAIMAAACVVLTIGLSSSALASGTLYLSYASCPASYPSLGDAVVNWSVTSDEPDNVALWVVVTNSGGTGSNLQAMARQGQSDSPWIMANTYYQWMLISGADSSGVNPYGLIGQTQLNCGYF